MCAWAGVSDGGGAHREGGGGRTSTRGSEMPNQRRISAHMVENGTAVDAPWYQSITSRVKKITHTTDGKRVAVRMVFFFQALPPKSL